jgi:TrmH family RNA methyltransferase
MRKINMLGRSPDMPIINSLNNFRVLQWYKLKDKKHRNAQKLFIAEGYHSVCEAFKTGFLKEVITTEKESRFDVATFQVTGDVMAKLSSLATPTKILGICHQKESAAYKGNLLLIDQIHHPGNLGTIIRSAVAFNVDTVVLDNSVDAYNQKVIQSARGMYFHINIIKRPLKEFMAELAEQNYQLIGTDVKGGVSPDSIKVNSRRAVLIGNESEGLSGGLLDLCDIKARIDMSGRCDSLNVGVAAGIILYMFDLKERSVKPPLLE